MAAHGGKSIWHSVLQPAVLFLFLQMPYYRHQTTSLHCGLWLGMAYIAALGVVGATFFEQGQDEQEVRLKMTWVRTTHCT